MLSQERALHAARSVLAADEHGLIDDYTRWCVQLPAVMVTLGLCQTVALLEREAARGRGRAAELLLEHFEDWLRADDNALDHPGAADQERLLSMTLAQCTLPAYNWALREALDYAELLRNLARAASTRQECPE